MLLLGVAECCCVIHPFAFTDSSVLLTPITFCFDLPAFASFKRQTNGNVLLLLMSSNQHESVIMDWV